MKTKKTSPMIKNPNSLQSNRIKILPFVLLFILQGVNNHAALAQCQAPTNLSPQQLKPLIWADFLDTVTCEFVLRINEIRANPKNYGQTVILPKIKSEKEDYTNPNITKSMSRTHSNYKIDKCDKQLLNTHTLTGQDLANSILKDKIAILNLANNALPQRDILPCSELTESTKEFGKYYLGLLAEGMTQVEISNYEQCHGKPKIQRDWGRMPVIEMRVHQQKGESIADFIDRLLYDFENFKDFIVSPYCTIGLSRHYYIENENNYTVWFIYWSHQPGSSEFVAKANKKT